MKKYGHNTNNQRKPLNGLRSSKTYGDNSHPKNNDGIKAIAVAMMAGVEQLIPEMIVSSVHKVQMPIKRRKTIAL